MLNTLNIQRSSVLRIFRSILVILCILVSEQAFSASERIVEEGDQFIQNKDNLINLVFSKQLLFIRLYPGNLCKQCSVVFRPLNTTPAELAALAHDEVIKIPSLSGSMLQDARYQGDENGNITITLEFSRIVNISVEQDASKKKITLKASEYERPAEKHLSTEDAIAGTSSIPDRIYVINLESSQRNITSSKLDHYPELKEYKNYVTRVEFNDQRWYRHRLGFAASSEEAAALLNTAKKYFPEAWIDTASAAEWALAKKFYNIKPQMLVLPKDPEKEVALDIAPKSKPRDLASILGVKPEASVSKALPTQLDPVTPAAVKPSTSVDTNKALTPEDTAGSGSSQVSAIGKPGSNVVLPQSSSKVDLPIVPPVVEGETDDKTKSLMERARQAIIAGDYPLAISIYTKLLSSDVLQERKDALEFLGVARERNGQVTQARLGYIEYLQKYPEGADAERVRQRLVGLTTASSAPNKELVKSEQKKPEAHWDVVNILSQYYRKQTNKTDLNPDATTDDSISTDFSSNGRYRGEVYDMRYQFNINNRHSFLENTSTTSNNADTRVNTMYIDIADKQWNTSYRVGRQTQNSHGVLGRFDGAFVSYRFAPQWKVNAVYGYPVDFTKATGVNSDKDLYGISMDMGTFAEHWDMNVYMINQNVSGIVDRQALGSELKYLSNDFTAFGLLDYDYHFSSLNTALFVGSWRFKDNTTVNLNLDYRNAPLLTLSNALNGLPLIGGVAVTSLSQLLQLYPESQVKQLAIDRTARSKTASVSLNMPLSEQYQINADVTASQLGATPSSTDPVVEGTPGTGTEYFYSTQLVANSFIFDNDITIFGLRYADASASSTISGSFSNRTNLGTDWRLNSRMYIDKQDLNDGTQKLIYRPSVKFDYNYSRSLKFEIELGYEYSTSSGGINGDTTESNKYIFFGYFFDF